MKLYTEVFRQREEKVEVSGSIEETLCLELITDIEDVETLITIVNLKENEEENAYLPITFSEFLSCFEVEGDVSSSVKISSIKMKKNISPSLSKIIYLHLSALISTEKELALDLFEECCLQVDDIVHLVLFGSLENSFDFNLLRIRKMFQTFNFLLNFNSNVDDKHRSLLQDVIKKVIRKQDMSAKIYCISLIWKCVLVASNCPSVLLFAEDWTRKLQQIRSFLQIKEHYQSALSSRKFDTEDIATYTLSGEFDILKVI